MARFIVPGSLATFLARAGAALRDETGLSVTVVHNPDGSNRVTTVFTTDTAMNNIVAQLLDDAIAAEPNTTVKTRLQAIKTTIGAA
jgi:hypothetical protein